MLLKSLPKFLFAAFAFFIFQNIKAQSEKEPNNTPATANTFALNGTINGIINPGNDTDWYKIKTNGDGAITVTFTSLSGSATFVNLVDGNGTTVLHSAYTASNFSYTVDGLAQGTYYIAAYTYYSDTSSYTITNSFTAAPVANDVEPDSTLAQANKLPLNDSVTGHIGYYYNNHRDTTDWYKLTTPVDGELYLSLSIPNNTAINFQLYDHDGTTLIHSSYTYNNGNYSVDGLAAGTYYVKISCYYNGQFAPYTLKDSLGTYNKNDVEPNGYALQAPTILSNRTTTGHVGFYYNQLRDTTDWLKIYYTGTDGNLQLTFSLQQPYTSGYSATFFQVYKDTSASPIFSSYFTSASNAQSFTGLAQGYYYIKIYEYYNGQFEAYAVNDSFTQANYAQISINSSKTALKSSSCDGDSITYNLSGSHSPYTVRLYKNGVLYDSIITSTATATFKDLNAGNYYATVYGDGATGAAYSKSATSAVIPPVPTALSTADIYVHTATLNWTKLNCVSYFKIQYRVSGTSTWTVVNTPGDTSKFALTNLQPYTSYVWEVASVDTAKGLTFTSAFADSATFTTLSDTAHIVLVVKSAGSACNSDTLKYKCTNSEAPYTVTLYRNGTVYGSPLSVTDTASFYNVPPGNYYATSTGTGSGGSYGLSDTTQIVPPSPTGLDTADVTTVTATLNWDPVSCANYYTVQYRVTGTTTWTMISVAANSLMLTGLTPDTKYTWRVSASDSFNNQTVTSIYSGTKTFKTESVLPVTFISFNGVLQNNVVALSWSTATEINNKGYEVQRSMDVQNFKAIGFVNGHNNSSQINNYTYTDEKMVSGTNYYRLKQIDNDGKFNYSSVIKIDYSKFDWSILGNPVSNNSWLQLQLDKPAHIVIQIVSVSGKTIQLIDKGNLTAGTYSIPLNLNNVSSGIYIVNLIAGNKQYAKKIIK